MKTQKWIFELFTMKSVYVSVFPTVAEFPTKKTWNFSFGRCHQNTTDGISKLSFYLRKNRVSVHVILILSRRNRSEASYLQRFWSSSTQTKVFSVFDETDKPWNKESSAARKLRSQHLHLPTEMNPYIPLTSFTKVVPPTTFHIN